jgi:DNA processing protein
MTESRLDTETRAAVEEEAVSPEDLLGSLDEVERKNVPKELFVRGDRSLLRRSPRVSIVGARAASAEGLGRTRTLVRALIAHDNAVIVSGLALGIDSEAHRAAMKAGGHTIAVLGTPLDRTYPRENRDLQAEIGARHLLVSQFPSGHVTKKYDFPTRNRTMALISHATVIVEASDSSGSLSQGWEALRLGRPLFMMKSVFEAPGLRWPRELHSYGAHVLADPDEIFDALPPASDDILADLAQISI